MSFIYQNTEKTTGSMTLRKTAMHATSSYGNKNIQQNQWSKLKANWLQGYTKLPWLKAAG